MVVASWGMTGGLESTRGMVASDLVYENRRVSGRVPIIPHSLYMKIILCGILTRKLVSLNFMLLAYLRLGFSCLGARESFKQYRLEANTRIQGLRIQATRESAIANSFTGNRLIWFD